MKIKLILFCVCFCAQLSAQNKSISYAGIKLNIPADYTVNEENAIISNNNYSVSWKEVPQILYENDVHKQMIKRMEDEMHARFLSGVQFTSQGANFIGKLYQLKAKEGIRFRILASGVVKDKPMILDMGFAKLPKQNSDLDDFMKQFIQFKS